jgi:membrane-bound ClpP family serine protease
VAVHGEIWNAVSLSGIISKGAKVRIVSLENLTLRVEKSK